MQSESILYSCAAWVAFLIDFLIQMHLFKMKMAARINNFPILLNGRLNK